MDREYIDFVKKDFDDSRYYARVNGYKDSINKIEEVACILADMPICSNSFPLIFDSLDSSLSFCKIIFSSSRTLWSITKVLELGNFADAYMLTRKFRDDLFFFLHMYISCKEAFSLVNGNAYSKSDYEIFGKTWLKNSRSKQYKFFHYFESLLEKEKYKAFREKFDIKERFKSINKILNSNVHGSGIAYLNYSYEFYKALNYPNEVGELINRKIEKPVDIIIYMTLVFGAMLAIDNPSLITSNDYVDALDLGLKPIENSQYWVIPMLDEFLHKGDSVIGKGCVDFLALETGCIFSDMTPS